MRLRSKKNTICLGTIIFCLAAGALLFFRFSSPGSMTMQEEKTVQMPVMAEGQAQKAVPEIAKVKKYKVLPGDTLSSIAVQYGLDIDTLEASNQGISETLGIGEELLIPPQKGVLHVVDMGDTLWTIANRYGVDVNTIMAANGKTDEKLRVNETLFVPGGKKPREEIPVSRATVSRFIWPVDGELSSDFGYRWGRLHAGIDIASDYGTPVQAARSGQVVFAGWNGSYGYTVKIEHGHGYAALYAHLSDYVVVPGQDVTSGQLIGYVGSTGYSTGPHLHFEVQRNGELVDPLSLLP